MEVNVKTFFSSVHKESLWVTICFSEWERRERHVCR